MEIIAKTVIARRGTKTETEMVRVSATTTGIVTVAKGTATEAATEETTDAIATGIVDQGIKILRSIQDAKTTADANSGNVTMNMAEEIARIRGGDVVAEEQGRLHPREGLQRLRDAYPYLNASVKHLAGTFMHPVMSSILPCKLSKLVRQTWLFSPCTIA